MEIIFIYLKVVIFSVIPWVVWDKNIKWQPLINWDDGTWVLDKLFSVLICMFKMGHTKPLKKLKIICKNVAKKIWKDLVSWDEMEMNTVGRMEG